MTQHLAVISSHSAFKEHVYTPRVVPILNWRPRRGKLPLDLGSKFVNQLRYIFGVARSSSWHLWLLLSGAASDPALTADIASLQAHAGAFAYWRGRGTVLQTSRWKRIVSRIGHHAKNNSGKLGHLMRERWGQIQFQRFCEHNRREAEELRAHDGATVYVGEIISTARRLFQGATTEERGVMLGAS